MKICLLADDSVCYCEIGRQGIWQNQTGIGSCSEWMFVDMSIVNYSDFVAGPENGIWGSSLSNVTWYLLWGNR